MISVPGIGQIPASEVIVAHFCQGTDSSAVRAPGACETSFLDATQLPRSGSPECSQDGYPDPAVGAMCFEPEGVDRIIGSIASSGP